MAVEKLGGWQDTCPHDGLGHRSGPGCGEKAKEKASFRLPSRKPETSQLVGLQIFLLRISGPCQHCR